MNAFAKKALAALVVATPVSDEVQRDVRKAICDGDVSVSITNGVATLTGHASADSKAIAERTAQQSSHVERVINLLKDGD